MSVSRVTTTVVVLLSLAVVGLPTPPAEASAADTKLRRALNHEHPGRLLERLERKEKRAGLTLVDDCVHGVVRAREYGTLERTGRRFESCAQVEKLGPMAGACVCDALMPLATTGTGSSGDRLAFGAFCGSQLPWGEGYQVAAAAAYDMGSTDIACEMAEDAFLWGAGRSFPDGRDGLPLLVEAVEEDSPARAAALIERAASAGLYVDDLRPAWIWSLVRLGRIDEAADHLWLCLLAGRARAHGGHDLVLPVAGALLERGEVSWVLQLLDEAAIDGEVPADDELLRARAHVMWGEWADAASAARVAHRAGLTDAGPVLAEALGEQAYETCEWAPAESLSLVSEARSLGLDHASLRMAAGCAYMNTPMTLDRSDLRDWLRRDKSLDVEDQVLAQVNSVLERIGGEPLERPVQLCRAIAELRECVALDPTEYRCSIPLEMFELFNRDPIFVTPGTTAVVLVNETDHEVFAEVEAGLVRHGIELAPGEERHLDLESGAVYLFAVDPSSFPRWRRDISKRGGTQPRLRDGEAWDDDSHPPWWRFPMIGQVQWTEWHGAGLLPEDTTITWSVTPEENPFQARLSDSLDLDDFQIPLQGRD